MLSFEPGLLAIGAAVSGQQGGEEEPLRLSRFLDTLLLFFPGHVVA